MQISKIVITGGPCGGKSSAMERIRDEFSALGYRVLFIAETATELINGGIAPWTCRSNADYQTFQMKLQLEKEDIYENAAESMDCEKILIVCDRGAIDSKAYMTKEDFYALVEDMNTDEAALRDRYDAVFHLVTTAKGAEKFYTTANNTARTETVQQAAELDDRIAAVWSPHRHHVIIDNSTDFENKLQRLTDSIKHFLEKNTEASDT
ncbi:MAG: ATP-binding protein [Clostridia bacterium]|nr:ATP-binding protein [Clostridia bacterium]